MWFLIAGVAQRFAALVLDMVSDGERGRPERGIHHLLGAEGLSIGATGRDPDSMGPMGDSVRESGYFPGIMSSGGKMPQKPSLIEAGKSTSGQWRIAR